MDPAPPVQKRTLLAKREEEKVGERKEGRGVGEVEVEEEGLEGMRD